MGNSLHRRRFLKGVVGASTLVPGTLLGSKAAQSRRLDYQGPNLIIIRFGGGARRRESIDPQHTYSPFLCHELIPRGTVFKNMLIDSFQPPRKVDTSHGQGTLYILTGKYQKYEDVEGQFLGQRFEAPVPTVFEYLRKVYAVPEHQTLIVNGEDRTHEEFYNFSNHHLFGVSYRSQTLSLFRFKEYLLRRQLAEGRWNENELDQKKKELAQMESIDYRVRGRGITSTKIEEFWERWRLHYGESGLVNPRGDRLLTELALRAIKNLRPRLMMVNYNDCDYVHWGQMSHYTRALAIMDQGIREIVACVEADAEYRDNTIFVIVPDCGRDNNPFSAVPCQHHFGSRSAHEIFAVMFGPGIAQGAVVDHKVDQIQIAATMGGLMGFETALSEAGALAEAFV